MASSHALARMSLCLSVAGLPVLLLLLLLLGGCRTNKDILIDYERDLLAGNYAHAAIEVSEKATDTGEDQLLWLLHAGSAQQLDGKGEAAILSFDAAEDLFLANDRESVFARGATGAFAMMTNDRVFPFVGGGQDRIFTCLYKALDFAAQGNVAATRTELNRAAQHQDNWLYERRRDLNAARERMSRDAEAYARQNGTSASSCERSVSGAFGDANFSRQVREHTGFDPTGDGQLENLAKKDYFNIYAQHVSGVFRWLTEGNARDYFRGLTDFNPQSAALARDCQEVAEASTLPMGQVWVYVEDGLGPCREEWRFDLPLVFIPYANRYVMYAGMALPYLRYRSAACGSYAIAAGGRTRPLELLQDLDPLYKVEHDVYMRGALTREISRTILKVGAQVALGVAADQNSDNYVRTALRCSQAATAAWAASMTQADLRNWTALPKRIYMSRIDRPQDGRVTLCGDGRELAIIEVPSGNSMVFITKPAASAKVSVRVVKF